MAPSTPRSQRFAFDRFEVNLRSGELLKDGRRLRPQSQPFQLLTLLLLHPGEVVTRDEIREKLWAADTFVDFDHSLGTAVNKIREALSDSADHPRFVETMPRRGYRFIGRLNGANGFPASESQLATGDAYPGVAIPP
jgi:DNA-binding winged helix-turn-helix (wHTH) protein